MKWFDSIKLFGTSIPNIFRAGTFLAHGDLVFWDVVHPENTSVVVLAHAHFSKLVIEVADPLAATAMIKNAMDYNR